MTANVWVADFLPYGGISNVVRFSITSLPIVAISATDVSASEGSDTGTFTVTRTGSTSSQLTVTYSMGGTATNGSDYNTLSGSVTIFAGSATGAITVTPIDDNSVEGDEAVVVMLSNNAAYNIGSPSNATVTIIDNDSLPRVTISAADGSASEAGSDTATFTVTRTGSTSSPLTVNYSIGGTATNGSDYNTLSGSVTIAAGSATAAISVTPINDKEVEGSETVVMTLGSGSGYQVDLSKSSATVNIADNDSEPRSVVTIIASTPNASETGATAGVFTITRTGTLSAPLTVNYSVSGTGTIGVDYQSLSGSIPFAAGSAQEPLNVLPIDDSLVEGNETVTVTLLPSSSYDLGSPNSATVTISDNDQVVPTLTTLSPSSILEAAPSFSLTVNGTRFSSGAVVQWNGSPRPTIFVSAVQLKAIIPTSDVLTPGIAQVTVFEGGTTSKALTFTIMPDNAAPVITRVLPASGPTVGNTRVTILGDHFKPELGTATTVSPINKQDSLRAVLEQGTGEGVFFGGVEVMDVVFVNRTQLEVTTPPNPMGATSVSVVQSTGSASLPNSYTYKTLPPVPAQAGGKRQQIPFVIDTREFRTNLGVNNLGEASETVEILLVDNNGLLVTDKSRSVPPQGMTQLNNVLRELEEASGLTGREGYLILDSGPGVVAWASQVDNTSLDPSLELSRDETAAASRVLLPSSVSSQKFRTSLIVINSSPAAGRVTIRARDEKGVVKASLNNQTLPARGYLFYPNFYLSLGLDNVFGPVEVEASGGIKILATERIYTGANTSAYFEGVDFNIASRTAVLPYAVDTTEFRTNLGINNVNETIASVTVSLIDENGITLGSLDTTVVPHGLTQLNDVNRQLLGSTTVTNREGTLRLEADQPIIGWTSQIDNVTEDPSLVVAKPSKATKLLIPSATNFGSFKSTLAVVNLATTSNSVRLTARANDGSAKATTTVTIPGRGLITYTDILTSLGLQSSFGPLEINSLENKPLLAVSRVYSNRRTGGYFEGLTVTTTP